MRYLPWAKRSSYPPKFLPPSLIPLIPLHSQWMHHLCEASNTHFYASYSGWVHVTHIHLLVTIGHHAMCCQHLPRSVTHPNSHVDIYPKRLCHAWIQPCGLKISSPFLLIEITLQALKMFLYLINQTHSHSNNISHMKHQTFYIFKLSQKQ